jgi:hypothetical protein
MRIFHFRPIETFLGVGSMLWYRPYPKTQNFNGRIEQNMEIPAVATTGFSRDWVEGMQEENKKLVDALRFYADRKNWMKRTAQMDNGAKAREILKGVVGYDN